MSPGKIGEQHTRQARAPTRGSPVSANIVSGITSARVTYQMMAGYWPTPAAEQDDPAVTAKMNAMAKIVISRTLRTADWAHTQLVGGDAAGVLAKLKQRPGKNMLIMGSSALTASLIGMGLVDEVRVMVSPVVLGDGKSLFRTAAKRISLTPAGGNVLSLGQCPALLPVCSPVRR
jgi:dihydrofolate reductase